MSRKALKTYWSHLPSCRRVSDGQRERSGSRSQWIIFSRARPEVDEKSSWCELRQERHKCGQVFSPSCQWRGWGIGWWERKKGWAIVFNGWEVLGTLRAEGRRWWKEELKPQEKQHLEKEAGCPNYWRMWGWGAGWQRGWPRSHAATSCFYKQRDKSFAEQTRTEIKPEGAQGQYWNK